MKHYPWRQDTPRSSHVLLIPSKLYDRDQLLISRNHTQGIDIPCRAQIDDAYNDLSIDLLVFGVLLHA